ncbi:fatty acid synthase alpha subunit Lsd1, partial [Dipsacomyces acuminosporus]
MSAHLQKESETQPMAQVYKHGLHPARWIESQALPEQSYLLTVPVSIPTVGLIQLMHLMVLYKTLGISPGELAKSFKVATGHSQGIMVAAALSMVTDEASFYTISRKVLGIMMVIGAFPQMDFPCATLNQSLRLDALKHEGAPYPMVSIQGLSRNTLEGYASQFNSQQQYSEDHVFIALENTRSHYVVSGELESMVKFVRSLRPHVASRKDDQTRVPLSQRKPKVSINYISVTVPYHCLLLEGSITKLYQYAVEKGWHLNSQDMNIPVRATEDGHDIRSERDLTRYLFRSGCILPVIWPKAIDAPGLTHVVDFGPGGYSGSGALAFRSIEGRGVAVICAGALVPRGSSLLGNKADLYKHQLKDITSALNWSEQFRPKLVRTAYNNRLHIDTPMHSILGLPPLMVAGMTPTTADTGFVAAIYNAGYHVELAGGGIYGANDLERKVSDLTHMIEPGCGITLNCIYVNQKQWSVQFPAMLRMRREGWPVAGLCIGGGVPSAENANYIISSLKSAGLRHVAFKPANSSAIKQVVAIARANSDFPVVLQWTGGRAGGHHSCEDFHQPILETYGAIRSQANIVLVAGSGFGDAKSTLPYITGDWSTKFGRAPMPFDGILLGSRVTVAKESGASQAVKELIASKSGFGESDWESASIVGNSGGVVSIESEFGEPNHVLATRGVALAHDMNTAIFSQPREKQVQLLHERKDEIISRLNSDYMRPWFGRKVNGQAADLEEMTYAEVINRLVELMYVGHQSRWIDVTYRNLVFDFVQRTEQRFRDTRRSPLMQACEQISEPLEFIARFIEEYPACQAEVLTSVDAMHFINLCKRRGQKPVPFVPVLDQDFKIWFTKDTIWQSNDLDAVVDRDPERIAMSLGPIAVRYANVVDEPIKDIMDGIYNEQIAALLQRYYEGDISSVPVEEYLGPAPVLYPLSQSVASSVAETEITYHLPSDAASLPDFDTWINNLAGHTKNWLHALLTSSVIIQDGKLVENYVRRIMRPRPGRLVTVELDGGEPASISITDSDGFKELDLFFEEEEDDIISLSIFHRNHAVCRAMCFDFTFNPSMIQAPIQEITDVREKRIQRFFIEIWQRDYEGPLESYYNSLDKHAVVRGKRTEVTKEDVSKYCRIIGNGSKHYPPNSKHATLAPMDYISILTSRNVFDRLTAEVAYIGLLNGVHLFNSVRYVEGQGPLVLGDMVDCASQITQIVNTDVGKKIEIATHIFRNGDRLAEVDSTFLCRGIDVDPKQTFRKVKEPATRVVLRSAEDVAVLESKEWFVYRDGAEGRLQPGSTVEFRLSSAYQYLAAAVYSSISTVGTVMLTVSDAQSLHIADVSFESGQSYGNPVTDYLEANGAVLDSTTLFDSGGYQIVSEEEGSTMTTVVHDDNWGYSLASGDCNPIHSNPYFADLAGLPGTITHGMWTSASTRRFIETYVANDHPGRVRAYSVSLIDMVFPKDRLETKLYHVGMKEGRMLIKGEIFNEKGDVVLACTSEVDQPATAYVFTGQGSQEVGMGMGLYQQSAAARSIWDRADRYMDDQYGISLLHIVKDNPRENYLRLKQLVDNRAGSPDRTPIWQDLSSDSDTLTFTSPTGLINATQFTQPAIVAFELAAFADLRSKSLVQHGATYAGHSMGEHSALFAVANIATVEDAIDIAFHRGMIMQSFIERDEHNRSEYTMVAANPSRVGPEFSEDHLHLLIGAIREHGQGLLEIVNYNVKDQQYVVAGSLKQLSVLGSALDKLAATKQKNLTAAHFGQTVADTVKRAIEQTAGAITELGRTRCTTPLTGIDVPFHSSHLLPGVDIFRSYLAEKLQARHIDCASLQNRYIPNVTAKPFTVSRKYSEDVFDATRSPVIQQLLATWDDSLLENEADVRCLAHTLLIELLSYQIALPVRWIDTQEQIFAKLGAERMIEIGPAPTLCGIANRTLPKLGKQQVDSPSVLHIIRDESTINYSDACLAESEAAAEPKGQPPTETAPNTRDQPAAQPPTLQSPPAAPVAPSAAPVAPSAAPVAPAVFAGQGIPDEQLSTIDVLQAVVAHKMKRGLDEVQTTKTLKELVGGKSTLQNEIIGDLHAEFGGNVPDKPEDLSLHELANGISGFDGALGKHTTAQISRLFSTKMPGGFAQSAARNILKLNYGLGPQRQDALLLAALMMEPPSRLGSEAEAKAWLDTVAQT